MESKSFGGLSHLLPVVLTHFPRPCLLASSLHGCQHHAHQNLLAFMLVNMATQILACSRIHLSTCTPSRRSQTLSSICLTIGGNLSPLASRQFVMSQPWLRQLLLSMQNPSNWSTRACDDYTYTIDIKFDSVADWRLARANGVVPYYFVIEP